MVRIALPHAAGSESAYRFSYLFSYAIDLPANAHTLTLPNNEGIKVFAVSVANETTPLTPAQPLFDTLEHTSKPTTVEQASK